MTPRHDIKGLSASDVRLLLDRSCGDLPDDLAEQVPQHLQVDVITVDLAGEGYLMTIGQHAVVVSARTESWFRQNFTIAHELGHVAQDSLCTGHTNASNGDEAGANRFAADLLMPEDEIRSIDWSAITLSVLAKQIWEWGVSTEALATRLRSLGISARAEVTEALSQSTRGLLRRHMEMPPGPDFITIRSMRATQRQFPAELVSRLETAVESGLAPLESLAFAQGIDVEKLETQGPITEDPDEDLSLLEGLD
ncbi:hypothetical protein JS278_00376 [Acidipropionibacterium virtanenii]|uniref:IrrE N-terminal-like domain-containing protein n=2 Tax=Acidipropionibacterium virtanenii TaxID=2057246 RepID=A0A344UQM5_9ACTN|nr:hypothetical protein JS278_00376 [Acidipropionibacterium virtanenii]